MSSDELRHLTSKSKQDPPVTGSPQPRRQPTPRSPSSNLSEPQNVFLFLLGIRLLNALTTRTFFQPDEYFQALEPAWKLAFGGNAGAWITWEWRAHLRSAIHPAVFSLAYRLADALGRLLAVSDVARAELLLAAPKMLQAFFTALGDFYTWRLATDVYGRGSAAAIATLILTVVSPWQWFTSTRTFSNSLEATLTVFALSNWPWHWSLDGKRGPSQRKSPPRQLRVRDDGLPVWRRVDELTKLRRMLLSAALATVLRPTNLLIWISLTSFAFVQSWITIVPTRVELTTFARESVVCGSVVLLLSTIVDRIFYEAWVFPPYHFLQVNVLQSLASFYGSNDWHYYISQGYPLLLTTALPFALVGIYRAFTSSSPTKSANSAAHSTLRLLSIVSLLVPAAFSNIAHKEVRFIYPLLPALHVISAGPLASFFGPLLSPSTQAPSERSSYLPKRGILAILLATNIGIAYYTTQIHNSGILTLTSYLRDEFSASTNAQNMTVGMLMPCHSTPWRSHLQFPPTQSTPGIKAWALTCEPPLNLNASQKAAYLDEADLFYADPAVWVKRHMTSQPPVVTRMDGTTTVNSHGGSGSGSGFFAPDFRNKRFLHTARPDGPIDAAFGHARSSSEDQWWTTRRGRRPWPDYLAFFAQLETTLHSTLRGSGYLECARIFNSHWHDDSRRVGDIVVWCLDERRRGVSPFSRDPWQQTNQTPWWQFWHGAQPVLEADNDRDSSDTTSESRQRILAGSHQRHGRPMAEGEQENQHAQTHDQGINAEASSFRRVVDKPFWKVRPPADG